MEQPSYIVSELPAHAQVVIVGAGIVGVSAAYELSKRGVSDVVVIDRGDLFRTGGSTSHAPGGVFQNNSSRTVSKLAQWSVETFLEVNEDGDTPVYWPTGSLEVATTEARWQDLHRKYGYARSWGLDAHLLSPSEVKQHLALIDESTILGAIHVARDGDLLSIPFVERLAARTGKHGARFLGRTTVTGFSITDVEITVATDRGTIVTGQVLICGGIWGPLLGKMAGVPIPLQPCAHPYVRTTPLPGFAGRTEPKEPLWRHQDYSMYFMQWDERYVVGSYRHEPVIIDPEQIDDTRPGTAEIDFDDEVFASGWQEAGRLVPEIRTAGRSECVYGMFSFTPDAQSLIGEVHGVTGLYLAEAIWVTHGPGAARAVVDLMVEGGCELDLREVDANRFGSHAISRSYIRIRGAQNYREVYDIIHPRDVLREPRGLRRTPYYDRQKELGSVFTESNGWERPLCFEANADLPVPPGAERTGWNTKHWSPIAAAEHVATRTAAGLFDMSTFTKLDISGPDAPELMARISCSNVSKPVGGVSYALLLNEQGGIETDLTVVRVLENRFILLCGSGSGRRDFSWIARQTSDLLGVYGYHEMIAKVKVEEITSASCALGIWGPNAEAIVQSLTDADLRLEAFPRFTMQRFFVAGAPVSAVRISYVGENGFELHTSTEFGGHLWEAVWEAGRAHGLVACGLTAMDSLRLEKGYLALGTDIRSDHTPAEAGLGFAVSKKRTNYIGYEALRTRPAQMRLSAMTFDDPGVVVIGKEPILHDNRVVGYVSSANFGYTIGKSIAYGYLPTELAEPGTKLAIEWFGNQYPVTVEKAPLLP
jgi:glycine cleavage system aminomethyltransferase T/glycine/D-amino acid oxidase-like deaminating enzyme